MENQIQNQPRLAITAHQRATAVDARVATERRSQQSFKFKRRDRSLLDGKIPLFSLGSVFAIARLKPLLAFAFLSGIVGSVAGIIMVFDITSRYPLQHETTQQTVMHAVHTNETTFLRYQIAPVMRFRQVMRIQRFLKIG